MQSNDNNSANPRPCKRHKVGEASNALLALKSDTITNTQSTTSLLGVTEEFDFGKAIVGASWETKVSLALLTTDQQREEYLSEEMYTDYKNRVWREENSSDNLGQKTHRRRAKLLEHVLYFVSDGNPFAAARTLHQLVHSKNAKLVREKFRTVEKTEAPWTPDKTVCEGVKLFLEHHTTKGSRTQEAQAAVDAVVTAAAFKTDEASVHAPAISKRIGTRAFSIRQGIDKARKLKEESVPFSPHKRKPNKNRIIDEARQCVLEWQHSPTASMLDPSSAPGYKVQDEDGNTEIHPRRIYIESGVQNRFNSFLRSEEYARFQETYEKTICLTRFRQMRCRCIREPAGTR